LSRGLARTVVVVTVAVLVVVVSASLFLIVKLPPFKTSPLQVGILIESVDWDNSTGQIKIHVLNAGDSERTLSKIYFSFQTFLSPANRVLDDKAAIVPQVLSPNQTAEITLSETYMVMPKQITVEVHAEDGSFCSYKKTFIG
jgi:hypothetical protein